MDAGACACAPGRCLCPRQVPVPQAGAQQHLKTQQDCTADAQAAAAGVRCCSINPELIWSHTWLMAAQSLHKQAAILLLFTLTFGCA